MSGTSEGDLGRAYRAIRRFDMSCSPRNVHAGVFAEPAGPLLRWSGSNMMRRQRGSSSKTLADQARQHDRGDAAIDELRICDGRVQADVMRFRGIARGNGILCRPVQLDVAERHTAEAANERTGVLAVELRTQVTLPSRRRPVVLPRLNQMCAVHPFRNHFGVGVGVGEADGVRLGQVGRRRRAHLPNRVGYRRQLARQDGC